MKRILDRLVHGLLKCARPFLGRRRSFAEELERALDSTDLMTVRAGTLACALATDFTVTRRRNDGVWFSS